MSAYQIEPLEDWQEAALKAAYARDGRRKMKIMELGAELGLDRTRILHWSKEFSQLPSQERLGILSQQQAVAEKERIKVERERVAEAAMNLKPHPDNVQPGFIPFFKRKEMGLEGRKRMPADVIRTLESIYSRTPFPSNEVIKGVWDLHRLSRETVLEWFVKRRETDGIKSSTQKRREKQRGDPDHLFIEDDDGGLGDAGPSGRRGLSQEGDAQEDVLAKLMSDVAPQEAKKDAKVYGMSRSEMASIRSALPSQRSFKGKRLAERMGVVHDESDQSLQIGDMKFVEETKGEEDGDKKWKNAFRFRSSSGTKSSPKVSLPKKDD
jgi:hypothetical protein